MHQTRAKKYDDGLTKQQRYVMRNKEKVYQANAARRRKEREEKRNAKRAASSANSPSETTTDLSERSEADRLQKVALIEEVDLLFHNWTQSIDESIARFDMCWNMKYGWINRTPFEGSKTQKMLQDKIESSSELLEKLRGVLKIVEPDTDDWNLALTRIQSTAFKTAQMTRILSYFDRSETKKE